MRRRAGSEKPVYDRSAAGPGGMLSDEAFMRWLMLTGTVLAFVLCFTRHSGGAMAIWLLLGLAGMLATGLAFAQARIAANARDESLSTYDLQRLREGKPPIRHE